MGAAVIFSVIDPALLGLSIVIILIGVTFRWIGAFCAALEPKYNNKERAFIAFAWIPKATVQAALGGVTIATATANNIPEYVEYGNKMLTTAVFAIVITAPLGAIFITTLGPRFLDFDGPQDKKGARSLELERLKTEELNALEKEVAEQSAQEAQ